MASALESLHTLVTRHFRAAKQSKSLIFSETKLAIIHSGRNVPFQLRYCPALQKKPGSSPKNLHDSETKPKPDPFENPSGDLLVADLDTHIIVLNKYPVIENHFIVATKNFKPQTGLLEPDDLSMTHACLQAWARGAQSNQPRRLFAFFNSGEHSGASQPHRHIQFISLEDMGMPDSKDEWQLLTDRMTSETAISSSLRRDPDLPFLHFAVELRADISTDELHSNYMSLLRAAINGSKEAVSGMGKNGTELGRDMTVTMSYNLAITTHTMAIFPRRSETAAVPSGGLTEGSVAINGTVLGGTLMVKDEHEFQSLEEKTSVLDGVLANIGFPVSQDGTLDQTKL